MKKSIFDLKLMREGMRQIRSLGILFLLLSVGISLFITLINGYYAMIPDQYRGIELVNQGPIPLLLPLALSFALAAPLMSLTLFSFLNQRKKSDFYHALPQSRCCLFLSFMGAITGWLFIMVFSGVLLTGLSTLIYPAVYHINWGDFLTFGIALFIAGCYVTAATALAMSASGTLLTNILLALLLVFGPRLFFMLLAQLTTANISVFDLRYLSFPLHPRANLITALFPSMMGVGPSSDPWGSSYQSGNDFSMWTAYFQAENILYTLGLALLFTLLAAQGFRRRQSEQASRPNPAGAIGKAIPFALALFPCLYALGQVYDLITGDSSWGYEFNFRTTLITLLLGPALYLTYSWFTTRKLSSFKKALPGLLLLPLILGLALGGMLLARDKIRAFRPSTEDLSYVRILDDSSSSSELYNEYSYYLEYVQEIRMSDPLVLTAVSRYLSEDLDRTSYSYPNGSTQEIIAFKTKAGAEYIRKIRISDEEDESLWDAYDLDEVYQQLEKMLPDESAPGFQLGVESIDNLWVRTSENMEALRRIYACMRQELSSDTIESDSFDRSYLRSIADIPFSLSQDGKNVSSYATISKNLPKATAQYFQEIKALQNRAAQLEKIKDFIERSPYYTMNINFIVVEDSAKWEYSGEAASSEAFYAELRPTSPKDTVLFHTDVLKLLDEISRTEDPDPNKILICCTFSVYGRDENEFHVDESLYETFWISTDTIPAFVQEGRADALFQVNCREVSLAFSFYRMDHAGENPRKASDIDEYFIGGFDSLQNVPEGAVYTVEDGVFTASYTDANGEVHTYRYPPEE